ncbi:MAG: hypothetical protein AB7P02_03475 [Alphaproteobacteria bacterium]
MPPEGGAPPLAGPRFTGLETSWRHRRRAVWATAAYCMAGIAYLTLWGRHDSRLHETIAFALTGLLGSVVMAYIAGAAYDDRDRRRTWAGVETARLRLPADRRADLDAAAG